MIDGKKSGQSMNIKKIRSILSEQLPEEALITDAEMGNYCSLRCGGRAALLVTAENMDELRYVLYVLKGAEVLFGAESCCGGEGVCGTGHRCCGKESCQSTDKMGTADLVILGNGTNLLVRDGGYEGVVLRLGSGFTGIRREGNFLTAGAAAPLSKIAKEAAQNGLSGLAFAAGIPASAGGAVFMNAGAYGGEMKDVVKSVRMISRDGLREAILSGDELEFSYRTSALRKSGDIVTEVTFELTPGDPEAIAAEMRELAERRNAKQPLAYPSAGSFFKRPQGHFAGALIEEAGLKGLSVGGAQVSALHAGFIINKGGASAGDVLALMRLVQNIVRDRSGVELVPEVQIIGRD